MLSDLPGTPAEQPLGMLRQFAGEEGTRESKPPDSFLRPTDGLGFRIDQWIQASSI